MDYLKDIKAKITEVIPQEAMVTSVELEGPEIAIYTKNPRAFFENENYVAKIAFELKKRINIRTDKTLLIPEEKAKKIIEEEFQNAFKNVDCIISPTVPRLPHKIGEKISVEDMYGYDALTIPSNLAGNCAISVPAGEIQGIPVGMQIMCDKFQEEKLLSLNIIFLQKGLL